MAASGAESWQTRVSPPRWQPSPRRQPLNATAVAAISLANIWHPPQISPIHTGFLHIPEGLRPGLVQPMCAWMDERMDGWMTWMDGLWDVVFLKAKVGCRSTERVYFALIAQSGLMSEKWRAAGWCINSSFSHSWFCTSLCGPPQWSRCIVFCEWTDFYHIASLCV